MAIVIEQEKKNINWVPVAGFTVIIIAIIATIYYVFVVNPGKIESIISSELKPLSEIGKIQFAPDQLTSNPRFKELTPQVSFTSAAPETLGKINLFLP